MSQQTLFEMPEPEAQELPDIIPALTSSGDIITLGRHTLRCGECIQEMMNMPAESVDAIITDPPYGIGFNGASWDGAVPGDTWAAECLRVLKPGGHLISFAATRTIHRLTVALEDEGFEVRDQIGWLQWQGFPKSLDVGKAIDRAAGALDEREVVGSYDRRSQHDNCNRGAMLDEARLNQCTGRNEKVSITAPSTPEAARWDGWGTGLKPAMEPAILCRKPLIGTVAENVLRYGTGGINIQGTRIGYGDLSWPGPNHSNITRTNSGRDTSKFNPTSYCMAPKERMICNRSEIEGGRWPANIYHCAKPGPRERGANPHPTLKPLKLMRWLCRLITPPGGIILEPFAGSGTTLIAADIEGFKVEAIEMAPEYCDIIRYRYHLPS